MPNWVNNHLNADGPADAVERLKAAVADESQELTFQAIIPRPADQDENWYDWQVKHWGTKWDACHLETEHQGTGLTWRFDTAWAPPLPVLEALAQQHPEITFTLWYQEEQGWGGEISVRGSDLLEETSWDIPSSHAELNERSCDCWCSPEEPVFFDCRYFAILSEVAAGRMNLDEDELLVVRGLSGDWNETNDKLANVARSIIAERQVTKTGTCSTGS